MYVSMLFVVIVFRFFINKYDTHARTYHTRRMHTSGIGRRVISDILCTKREVEFSFFIFPFREEQEKSFRSSSSSALLPVFYAFCSPPRPPPSPTRSQFFLHPLSNNLLRQLFTTSPPPPPSCPTPRSPTAPAVSNRR